jgi:AmmeMemoRadiSam system protein A
MELRLDEEDKNGLLAIARKSIEGCFRPAALPEYSGPSYRLGAFVTLHEDGRLRGCIGRMASDLPIAETVSRMAKAAAFEDPRFEALSEEELTSVNIEISLLGPMLKISDPEELHVGRHGIYIYLRGRSGVLLPQVAVEYGWDRYVFLDQVCYKAGLPPGAWKDPGAELYIFEGLIFGEIRNGNG